jgi:excisionase family DNA binding protein
MEKSILTIQDLATYTGWSKSYIYKKTSDGTLKFSKPLGKTIFFSKIWVDEFLLSNTSATAKELDIKASTAVTLKNGGLRK